MTNLPAEFSTIGLLGQFKAYSTTEFHGPCPFCGGEDRFVIYTDRPFPSWNFWCRICGKSGWADQLNTALKVEVTPEQRAAWQQAAGRKLAEAADLRRQAQHKFCKDEIWLMLHDRMKADNRAWWRKQGVPDEWQDYWRLGYTEAAPVAGGGSAYTIPFFRFGWEPENMQYRLCCPPEKGDKYRWAGLGFSSFFVARPDMGLTDQMLITEGAKKAMVTVTYAPADWQIFAVPSKSDFAAISETVTCGEVWICLDPDAKTEARALARLIPGARVVDLPGKIDDVLSAGATWRDIQGAMRYGRRTQ